ncbi:MAG: hypothetical protein A2158_05050 [Chloroflexi bacterium RBG_13_46_14]|nr:MAG: hypothetical protein A2158_05050 [Chloroflexi bacterium RBG_13_46_14]
MKRVLIVEDEPAISSVCQRILNKEGFITDIVDNGEAAEKAVIERQYDLLLLDIRLPIESGAEFYVWLLQEYPQLSRRVIFMTGSVMGGDTINLLKRSGQPYLLKPFRPEELIEIVMKTLEEVKND